LDACTTSFRRSPSGRKASRYKAPDVFGVFNDASAVNPGIRMTASLKVRVNVCAINAFVRSFSRTDYRCVGTIVKGKD
jgi:hypothetical protein